MRRKCLTLVFACLFLLLAVACGTHKGGQGDPIPGGSTAVLKIVRADEYGGILAVSWNSDYAGLYFVGLRDDVNITGENGENLSEDDLHAGMIVEIRWPGMVQYTWPEQINQVASVRVMERDNDLVGLYRTVLRTLWELEPELNRDITYAGWDFSTLTNLSEAEIAALKYLLRIDLNFGMDVNSVDGAYIDKTAAYLENGVLLTIELVEQTEDGIVFNAIKWRGTEHAAVLTDCMAVRGENGIWSWDGEFE